MKKSIWLLLGAFLFFGCQKEDPPLFTIPLPPVTITVDQTMSVFDAHFFNRQVETNALDAFNSFGAHPDSVNHIRPVSADLTVIFNDGRMDFIRAASIRICKVGEPNGQECGKEAFWRDPVPDNIGFDLSLTTSNIQDMRDLILEENVNIQIILEALRWNPERTFDIRVQVEFGVW